MDADEEKPDQELHQKQEQNLARSDDDEETIIDTEDEEFDEAAAPLTYDIVSYGSDPEVETLVHRLNRGDIFMPSFQRDFVWSVAQASRLVESLLLGLPVPGIFLAQDRDNKQLVIDGQQRLRSLQYFYNGVFNPKNGASGKKFALTHVQPEYEGKTYEDLDERDRAKLDTSIIHATVIKQVSPDDDNTSLFHVFERLNTGATKLSDQEIRVALYNGDFLDFIADENDYEPWRELFGPKSLRLKDQELIIRFFALYECGAEYAKPMREFLNRFCGRKQSSFDRAAYSKIFEEVTFRLNEAIGRQIFRPEGSFNAAVFDSCMVGLAKRLASGKPAPTPEGIRWAYDSMMSNDAYREAISRATSDGKQVDLRIRIAEDQFAAV